MRKRILALILICLLCLATVLPATAEREITESPSATEEAVEASGASSVSFANEQVRFGDLAGTLPTGEEISKDYLYPDAFISGIIPISNSTVITRVEAPSEGQVPEEVLGGTTEELLDYFLHSDFVKARTLSYASTPGGVRKVDFTRNEAYKELLTRDDLVSELEKYSEKLLEAREAGRGNDTEESNFAKLMNQKQIAEIINGRTRNLNQSLIGCVQGETVMPAEASAWHLNGIEYSLAGSVKTANGADVPVYTASRELTQSEKNALENATSVAKTKLSSPSAYYNCHSFAWYRYNYSNPYWIDQLNNYVSDEACSIIDSIGSARVNDIIIYGRSAANGFYPLHSGVIESWDSDISKVKIRSKWGQGAVYSHLIQNVPNEYLSEDDNGTPIIEYIILRYHDYSKREYIRNYHSGAFHFYEYNKVCAVCRDAVFDTPVRYRCSGPPCKIMIQGDCTKTK